MAKTKYTVNIQHASSQAIWLRDIYAVMSLAYPSALANLAQLAIGVIDLAFVGRIGPKYLAAASLGINIYSTILVFGIGFASAAVVIIVQEIGRRAEAKKIASTIGQGIIACGLFGLLGVFVLFQTKQILISFGQDQELSKIAEQYMDIYSWSLIPSLLSSILRGITKIYGRPIVSLWGIGLALFLNAGVCPLLVFGAGPIPAMGIQGAAVAGLIANSVLFLGLLAMFNIDPVLRRYNHPFSQLRPDFSRLWEAAKLGTPIAISFGLQTITFSSATFLVGQFGQISAAAHAIALQFSSLTYMVPLALAQAVTVLVGMAAGRGDTAGLSRAGWAALIVSAGFMSVITAVALLAPHYIAEIYLSANDPISATERELAEVLIRIAGVFQIFNGIQAVASGALRGIKDTRTPMILTTVGLWGVGIPAGALLAFTAGLKEVGVWAGIALGLGLLALLMLARWYQRQRLGLITSPPQ